MLAFDIAVIAALYAWQIGGNQSAGNVFRYWVWFVSVISLTTLIAPPKYSADFSRGARRVVSATFDVLLIASMAWFGLTGMAIAYTVAEFLGFAYQSRCNELKPEVA